MSPEEENKALLMRFLEDWNRGLPNVEEFMAPNLKDHSDFGEEGSSLEVARESLAFFREAFPDLHYTPEAIIAEGDLVAVRGVTEGTHLGEFMGIPATGKKVSYKGMTFLRIANGQIVELWSLTDDMALVRQLEESVYIDGGSENGAYGSGSAHPDQV